MTSFMFGATQVVVSSTAAWVVYLVDRLVVLRLCSCGHEARAHEHYRAGSDCGSCGRDICPRYRYRPLATRRP